MIILARTVGSLMILAAAPQPAAGQQYVVTDTTSWEIGGNGGLRGVLWRGSTVIDSIDIYFGFHVLGPDTVVYLQIRSEDHPVVGLLDGPTHYILWTPEGPANLGQLLPRFDTNFSSPTVLDSRIVYWGLSRTPGSRTRLFAMRAELNGKADSVLLDDIVIETDNFGHFAAPRRTASGDYEFVTFGNRYLVVTAFRRLLRRSNMQPNKPMKQRALAPRPVSVQLTPRESGGLLAPGEESPAAYGQRC